MNFRNIYTMDHIRIKKRLLYILILCLILSGCGTKYTDGTYEAKSGLYEGDPAQNVPGGDYGIVRIRIENGKFTPESVKFKHAQTYERGQEKHKPRNCFC